MKRILVTGGAGFIGSNFIYYLFEKYGEEVIVLNIDKLTYSANLTNLESIENQYGRSNGSSQQYFFQEADIANEEAMAQYFAQNPIDYVVNFAAESHVDRSLYDNRVFVLSNVLGTQSLLQQAMNANVKRFLQVSTDEVYGSLGPDGEFTEQSNLQPNSPYAASKAGADCLARSFFKSFQFPVLISRCSNNYGPYQFPEKLIPLMVSNAMENKQLPVYGKGDNVRDWLHVKDHCDAIQSIILNGKIGESYNIGGNNEMTNLEIATKVCSVFDKLKPSDNFESYTELITFVEDRPGHDYRYAVNTDKIKKETGWSPRYNFNDAIEDTAVWYIKNEKWWKIGRAHV